MAITQIYTAVPGDVITAARWNNEFGNIYNNLVPLLSTYRMLNIKDDYSAVGDGAASDQSAVASAVAAAYSAGRDIYWPAGTYKTTATIPHLHDVFHHGPGIIKRGSNLFYVDPSVNEGKTNALYVSTTGVDTNDGLSSSEPMLTPLAAGNIPYGYSYGDNTWQINFAAGTYTVSATSFVGAWPTPNRVQFLGASVSVGTANAIGIYFQEQATAQISNIKFTGYRSAGAPAYNGGGYGMISEDYTDIYCSNIHITDCDTGVHFGHHSIVRYTGGIISACAEGVRAQFFAVFTLGYAGSAADITGTTGTAILNCTTMGLQVSEWATGHANYTYFGSNATGILLAVNARCHAVSSTFISNTIAVNAELNSNIYDTACTWTSNATNIVLNSGSRSGGDTSAIDESSLHTSFVSDNDVLNRTTSSTVAPGTTFYTRDFVANEFANRGTGWKLKLAHTVTGNAGTKTILVKLGATTLLTATIAAATTASCIEVDFYNVTTANTQVMITKVEQNGVLPVIATSNPALDMTAALTLTLSHYCANGADTSKILLTVLEIGH